MSELLRSCLEAVLAALVGVSMASACGEQPDPTPAAMASSRDEASPSLRRQAKALLEGVAQGLLAGPAGPTGLSVIVNRRALRCGPCRNEFPSFARLAARHDRRIAFLGVYSRDSSGEARDLLQRDAVPWHRFLAPDGETGRVCRDGRAMSTPAFYRADGELSFTHVGRYAPQARLAADINWFALDG